MDVTITARVRGGEKPMNVVVLVRMASGHSPLDHLLPEPAGRSSFDAP